MGKYMSVFVVLFLVLCSFSVKVEATPFFSTDQIIFADLKENAAYESTFGLYAMNDPSQKYQVFGKNKEPGAIATVTDNMWSYLDEGFGFYFNVFTGGTSDTTADYTWFSDKLLNQYAGGQSVDTSVEHVQLQWATHGIIAKLDDQLGGGDRDFDDMKIAGIACKLNVVTSPPAPVPEPATMILFGTGLAGLAGISRKKKST